MGVNVTVQIRNEWGEVIDSDPAGGFAMGALLPEYDDTSFPYLRFVDPYGLTVYNSLELSQVIPELERLRPADEQQRLALTNAIEFARRCTSPLAPGLLLVFVGD